MTFQKAAIAVLCGLSAVAAASADCGGCSDAELACVCAVAAEGDEDQVFILPLAAFDREPARVGRTVDAGDEVIGTAEGAAVELRCPRGSSVQLHGRFRVVVESHADDVDCAIDLLAGAADITTDGSTAIESGVLLMGSLRTLYGMRLSRVGNEVERECVVFDGEAEVKVEGVEESELSAGQKAAWRGRAQSGAVVRLARADIDAAANLYTRIDLARAQADGEVVENPETQKVALKRSYMRVLSRPTEPESRLSLAVLQTNLGNSRQALYHLAKAETQEDRATVEQKAMVAYTKSTAYAKIGQQEDSERELERAKQLDPEVLQRATDRYELRPVTLGPATHLRPTTDLQPLVAVRPSPLTLRVTARPDTVRRRRSSRIEVLALDADGSPVSGVKVTIRSGGGEFRGTGRTSIDGVTDSAGRFTAAWFCTSCASSYLLGVEAEKSGYETANGRVAIRVP